MRIPNPYFENIPYIGKLEMDYIIFEDGYPVLFVCKDMKSNLYLCDCCDVYKEQRWLIAPISLQTLEQLFKNEISIRSVFENADGKCCIATWKKGNKHEEYQLIQAKEFLNEDLPDFDAYIDADEEEILEHNNYISAVKSEISYQIQLTYEKYMNVLEKYNAENISTSSIKWGFATTSYEVAQCDFSNMVVTSECSARVVSKNKDLLIARKGAHSARAAVVA